MKRFPCTLTWPILTLLMAACASQPSSAVRKTIQTYRVGVTTFADFKKDANLEEMKPDADEPPTHSYLNPELDSMDSKITGDMPMYTTSEKSPWKIIEQGAESGSTSYTISGDLFGKSSASSSQTNESKFVVGDSKGPICILIFDGTGKLTEIKPLP